MTVEQRHRDNTQRWNVESLKEYVDTIMAKHEEINAKEFIMTEKAVIKAEQSNERRLEGMNEFREQLSKQANTFLTKDVYVSEHKFLASKVESITRLVYIGIGLLTIIQIAIGFVMALLLR